MGNAALPVPFVWSLQHRAEHLALLTPMKTRPPRARDLLPSVLSRPGTRDLQVDPSKNRATPLVDCYDLRGHGWGTCGGSR